MIDGKALFSLDLKPIADVTIQLMNKLESCIGWIASPKGTMPEAIQQYVTQIKSDESIAPLPKAAMISNAQKTIKEYARQRNIVEIALQHFDGNEEPKKIDDDWLSHFFDEAKHISSSDIQLIWGKILASECKNPGNVSKLLLHTLSHLEKGTAELFAEVCNHALCVTRSGQFFPIVIKEEPYFISRGLGINGLRELEEAGLITTGAAGLGFEFDFKEFHAKYFEYDISVVCEKDPPIIKIGSISFTKIGSQLQQAVSPEYRDGFLNACKKFWENKNLSVSIVKNPR